jgi:CRP-like cAMP-binding protein
MTIETVQRSLREQYPEAQYHFVQFLSEHLVDCARVFEGDLTQMVVLAILGQAMLGAHRAPGDAGPRRSITASRIADVSGLDRETVRRKLKALAARGWIGQNADRSWEIASERDSETRVRHDLAELDGRGLDRLARLYVALRPICEKA